MLEDEGWFILTVKWFDSMINKKVEKAKDAYSIGVGMILSNQMSEKAHVQTGLLRNSIIYKYNGQKKPFGTERGTHDGRNAPTIDEEISDPGQNILRVGSAVVYAGVMEKNHGWARGAIDEVKRSKSLEKLGKEIFRKFFK